MEYLSNDIIGTLYTLILITFPASVKSECFKDIVTFDTTAMEKIIRNNYYTT